MIDSVELLRAECLQAAEMELHLHPAAEASHWEMETWSGYLYPMVSKTRKLPWRVDWSDSRIQHAFRKVPKQLGCLPAKYRLLNRLTTPNPSPTQAETQAEGE